MFDHSDYLILTTGHFQYARLCWSVVVSCFASGKRESYIDRGEGELDKYIERGGEKSYCNQMCACSQPGKIAPFSLFHTHTHTHKPAAR
jgi:hypothetical protein